MEIIQAVIEIPHSRNAVKISYQSRPSRYRFRRRRYTVFLLLINPQSHLHDRRFFSLSFLPIL
jgi:hypothetical protein